MRGGAPGGLSTGDILRDWENIGRITELLYTCLESTKYFPVYLDWSSGVPKVREKKRAPLRFSWIISDRYPVRGLSAYSRLSIGDILRDWENIERITELLYTCLESTKYFPVYLDWSSGVPKVREKKRAPLRFSWIISDRYPVRGLSAYSRLSIGDILRDWENIERITELLYTCLESTKYFPVYLNWSSGAPKVREKKRTPLTFSWIISDRQAVKGGAPGGLSTGGDTLRDWENIERITKLLYTCPESTKYFPVYLAILAVFIAVFADWSSRAPKVREKKCTPCTVKTAILKHHCCERKIPILELNLVPLACYTLEIYITAQRQLNIWNQVFPVCFLSTVTWNINSGKVVWHWDRTRDLEHANHLLYPLRYRAN